MQRSTVNILLIGIVFAAILAVVILGAVVVLRLGSSPQLAAIPTVAMLPSQTNAVTLTQAPTLTPTHTATRQALPPTWTITPTPTVTPTLPAVDTATADATQAPTRLPTLSPSQLVDTYWDGDGYGSMFDLEFEDGSYPRFTIFPVNLWVGGYGDVQITEAHELAVQNALREIEPIVPIQRVQNRLTAHITLWLMTDAEFDAHASCDYIDLTVGCTRSTYTDAGFLLNTVWLRVTDECFAETLLHELTHALGVHIHSPNPTDIMYAFQTCGEPRYSPRDIATLRTLYAAPAYNPRGG